MFHWTHPSVKELGKLGDPSALVEAKARSLVLTAIQKGWTGPPYDPFELAGILGVTLRPSEDVMDACLISLGEKGAEIQFNPNRPASRIKYSIAHELAHTLFPDFREHRRNRLHKEEMSGDDWQLEMLCNIGAAELLMPVGSFRNLLDKDTSIDSLLDVRRRFDVSMESILLRVSRISHASCAVFCASPRIHSEKGYRYALDYSRPSRAFSLSIPQGLQLPSSSIVAECTAIGYTAKGDERWLKSAPTLHVECTAIPSYPGDSLPRVVGIVSSPSQRPKASWGINYLVGNALKPRGQGVRVIAHVVNDKALNWGAGFGRSIQQTFPDVHASFRDWVMSNRSELQLGNTRLTKVSDSLHVAQLIAQKGYGPERRTRVRYGALLKCLDNLSASALKLSASVHMPRIGCGEGGGDWQIISELVEEALCKRGISVTIYDLPERTRPRQPTQGSLFGG
jgi:Zn-dependent peptidase ImmA (M78 family)/O-acetyl-ADP-ribose deacetylase (regulator of RNase III)